MAVQEWIESLNIKSLHPISVRSSVHLYIVHKQHSCVPIYKMTVHTGPIKLAFILFLATLLDIITSTLIQEITRNINRSELDFWPYKLYKDYTVSFWPWHESKGFISGLLATSLTFSMKYYYLVTESIHQLNRKKDNENVKRIVLLATPEQTYFKPRNVKKRYFPMNWAVSFDSLC